MKFVNPNVEIITPSSTTFESELKLAEIAGRVSYQSQDKITDDSYKDFIAMLIKNKHYAPLEFATVYLTIRYNFPNYKTIIKKYSDNKFSWVDPHEDECRIVTNYRVLVENGWEDDLKYWNSDISRISRMMVKFTLPIGISREFIRHRAFSFMEESTRFNNYSKDKFDNNLTFIEPINADEETRALLLKSYKEAENCYMAMMESGEKPQIARDVLPLGTKTTLYMCGFQKDWEHFFKLRSAKTAHPLARHLALMLKARQLETYYNTNSHYEENV